MNITKTALALAVNLLAFEAYGAAFALNEHSASGLGRAFAGEGAMADNAAVLARNPAAMARFKQAEFSVAGTVVGPDVSLEGVNNDELDEDSIAPDALIPALYYVQPLNRHIAVGVGAFSNFGLSTELPDDYAAGQLAGETSLITVNINASAALRFNKAFSLGLGLNLVYADATLIRHLGANPYDLARETEAANMTGDDVGYGVNVGLLYEITPDHRISLAYRSRVDLVLSGDYSNELPAALGGLAGETLAGELELTLPNMAEFSGLHQLTANLALHYSVAWTGWSSFERLEAYAGGIDSPVFEKDEFFENSVRSAVGISYNVQDVLTLRAGVAYDETPIEQAYRSISIPDSNRIWYSTGLTYHFKDASSFDFGMSFIKGEEVEFTETDDSGQAWQFTSNGDATLVSAQYNYRF
ncbi:outer membrane protein transport protein [Thalassomonas viridans]|uniref:Outer membrane protein transport protein n=1 Tax=Thalassomonas viridans TaxID=137584 RepID=A0AAE9Z8B3_9GAMM|nr:outer membrane protein transport protein [Thalassomonas viridans]WDE08004.1 outer membrane protein transport protein [Thalassomonas viridans]